MTTYASPRLTKRTLQVLISLIFICGCYMLIISIIRTINYVSQQARTSSKNDGHNEKMAESNDEDLMSRFPSISAPSVQLMLALLTFGHGIMGIITITTEKMSWISSYSYILLIGSFIKLLFTIASLMMFPALPSENLLSLVSTMILITAMVEIILIMVVCQFGKLVKRGDAARQEIQSIHSYHLERRSRSRSQSQSRFQRSFHGSSSPYPIRPTPILINSSPNSRAVSAEPSMMSTSFIMPFNSSNNNDNDSTSYQEYIPPPIYLQLDR